MSSGLQIRDLTLRIGGTPIVSGISFDVPSGQITGLAGESGSGKTMTGLSICGLQPKGAERGGTVEFAGRNLIGLSERAMNAHRGTDIAMIFQDPTASLHPMLRIEHQLTDHLRFHERMTRQAARSRAIDLLASLHVPEPAAALRKYPHEFSGGQLQRIAIAIAMICRPQVLIADEPTTALDVTVQAGILRLLRELCDEYGLAILLVSHDLGVMSAVADSLIVMRRGEVVESGTCHQVITDPKEPYTRSLIDSLPAAAPTRVATTTGLESL
ncbi:ABC transporter ATP-binding protein [Leucobacter sp. L43]|uniref:ABC transporter ATP-binding protein n=1 Tax=Leucobacter sp. L43 TaxID=2798040 RepID=UPI0019045178